MQYKIPVQIENEDPIIWPLSLRQLAIIMVGSGIAYSLFKWLEPTLWSEIAAAPSIVILTLAFAIAIFKHSEMTFVPFVLALTRFHTNNKERKWVKWVDSMQPLDIGYVTNSLQKREAEVDLQWKMDKIKDLQDNINKI